MLFHPLLLCNWLVHEDKQQVAQLFYTEVLKALRKRMAQSDDAFKGASAASKLSKHHNFFGIYVFTTFIHVYFLSVLQLFHLP